MTNNHLHLFAELHIFTVVVECGGFTAAADKLGFNKPLITRAIQRLERALGVRLLNRTTRRVGVTDEGRALYERCQPGLEQACRALSAARESRTEASGLLRITSPIAFGRRFIAPLALEFRRQYPQIEIDLSLTDEIVDLVSSGIDVAIRGGLPDDSRLIIRPLAPMPLYVCASPEYLRQHGVPGHPQDLLKYDCITYRFRSTGNQMAWEFSTAGTQFSMTVDGPMRVDDIEIAKDAALAGEGFVQLPGYIAVEHLRKGDLAAVLLEYLSEARRFALTYVNRHQLQPLRDRLFAEHIVKSLVQPELFMLSDGERRLQRMWQG